MAASTGADLPMSTHRHWKLSGLSGLIWLVSRRVMQEARLQMQPASSRCYKNPSGWITNCTVGFLHWPSSCLPSLAAACSHFPLSSRPAVWLAVSYVAATTTSWFFSRDLLSPTTGPFRSKSWLSSTAHPLMRWRIWSSSCGATRCTAKQAECVHFTAFLQGQKISWQCLMAPATHKS